MRVVTNTWASMFSLSLLSATVFWMRLLYDALPAGRLHRSPSSTRQHIWSELPRESSSPVLNPLFIWYSRWIIYNKWIWLSHQSSYRATENSSTYSQRRTIEVIICNNRVSFREINKIHDTRHSAPQLFTPLCFLRILFFFIHSHTSGNMTIANS